MSEKLTTASVLAFERKLNPSDAVFHAGRWDDRTDSASWVPVKIEPKSVRGTISNRLKTKDQDAAKLDAAIENPNLQTVDIAALPPDADTLRVQFTLRVLAGVGEPSACNNVAYRARLRKIVNGYVEKQGFTELANRYAANLANGRFLWRNRLGAENAEVEVAQLKDDNTGKPIWKFDALKWDLCNLDSPDADVKALGSVIANGLKDSQHPVLLKVTAWVRLGNGQEVFPSQELILDRSSSKSKTLYKVQGIAAIHSQKIGNALRAIDTWYENAYETGLGPIAVEPYGSVTTQGKAYRQPRQKQDFYTLLDNWLLKDAEPELEQQHFVMAVLIRGGVFGDAS